MRVSLLVLTLVAAGTVLRRRAADRRSERALWAEAGTSPDLR